MAAVALIFSAAAAFALQAPPSVKVGLDMQTEGNTGSSVGTIDGCRSVNIGDTFDVDVVVQDVPDPLPDGSSLGIGGYGFNLHFDPAVVQVTSAQNGLMVGTSSPYELIQPDYVRGQTNPGSLPSTSGDLRIDYLDLSTNYESGDGVLSRLTLTAVGAGTSDLTLDAEIENQPAPGVFMALGDAYNISQLQNAVLKVGASCEGAPVPTPFDPPDTFAGTPTPVPGSGSPTPAGSPAETVPVGDTYVAADAVVSGNDATHVEQIDPCAAASNGETFNLDVVIKGVQNLLAWEALVTYDPSILRVDDRNVKLFLNGDGGSQVFDSSQQTPNTTGSYGVAAVDQSDPVKPDSGDGVLVRLTMTAIGTGTSVISLQGVDQDGDGHPDRGVLLRNVDAAIIGDTNGDSWFDGPVDNAEIRVGTDCPGGAHVLQVATPSGHAPGESGDSSSNDWILIVAGVAIAVVAVGGGGYLVMRGRKRNVAP